LGWRSYVYVFVFMYKFWKACKEVVAFSIQPDYDVQIICWLKNDECLKWMPSTRRILVFLQVSPLRSLSGSQVQTSSSCWVVQYRQVQPSSFFQLARLRAESKEHIKTIWVVSKNRGKPPKWMVKIMEIPIKMDDLGGKATNFRKHPYKCPTHTTFGG